MESVPARPTLIEYETPKDSPWRPMIRLMAAAAIGLGVTHSFNWFTNFTWLTINSQRLSGLLLIYWVVQLAEAVCGVGLAIGGCMAWSDVRRGRQVLLTFAGIQVAGTVAMHFVYVAAAVYRSGGLVHSVGAFEIVVMPAVIWIFFRRPEVVAAMTREQSS